MNALTANPWVRAAVLGATSGARSMSGLAALGAASSSGRLATLPGPLSLLSRTWIARLVRAFAIGEMLGDKLPTIPRRTSTLPWLFRGLYGALAGASVTVSARRSPWIGGIVGGVSATIFTPVSERLRGRLHSAGVPDPLAGLIEDIAVTAVARRAAPEPRRLGR